MDMKYVDVFYGNGETDRFIKNGTASKWFYIKALCGNTFPHAVLPFGRMSVGAYSGGYPTGYGTHFPNSCCGVPKFSDIHKIRGFSHLHQSGTGGIRYYYNYAIATPFYGDEENIFKYYPLDSEHAVPGYYEAEFNRVLCRLTVSEAVAVHKYLFKEPHGRIAVDFSNDGLSKLFPEGNYGAVEKGEFKLMQDGLVCFSGIFSGIKLYFAAQVKNAKVSLNDNKMYAVFDFDGNEAELRLTYSTIDFASAVSTLNNEKRNFSDISKAASDIWQKHLSAIELITDDEELKEKFYSNFYHTLIKPADMTGESVLGISGNLVTDLATLWDQYKTQLPLVFLLYPEMGKKIADCIINISRTLGKIPCSLGMSDIFPCEEQAKMLGIFVLLDAYYLGLAEICDIEECIKRELSRDDFELFLKTGVFERYTHIIDTADACDYAARIVKDDRLREQLLKLAGMWVNAYDADGLMSEKSPYYEGDRYTYSFRPQADMEKRIALAGGCERFTAMLDSFFGFGKPSVEQITGINDYKKLGEARHHRFEGFNNECDMESPYSYIYAGCHDRLCEIVHACVKDSFGTSTSGLPGNNDSGGLSSCFMWNVLGLFPLSGSGTFLLGAPQAECAVLHLPGGKDLTVKAQSLSKENIYVEKILFNGKELTDYTISVSELLKGGTLTFFMKP